MAERKGPATAPATTDTQAEVVPLRRSFMRGMGTAPKSYKAVALAPMPPVATVRAVVLDRIPGAPAIPDLSGKRRVVVMIGAGNAGKTMAARTIASERQEAGTLAETMFAAADPGTRSLAMYVAHVEQPETTSPDEGVRWMRELFGFLRDGGDERPPLTLLDCGGNNTSLPTLINERPNLVHELEAAGMEVVIAYFLTPRVDDLAVLEHNTTRGFVSKNTLLVLNLGKAEGLESYDPIRAQPAYAKALEAGAAELVMPKLAERVSLHIERNRLPLWQARDGSVPKGLEADPLPVDDRPAVTEWLANWRDASAPVASWIR